MRLIMLKGLPASGKSTWAKNLVELDPTFVRVNKDDIRAELIGDGKWTKAKEKELVIPTRNRRIQEALAKGNNVVVDDTNLEPIHEKTLSHMCEIMGVAFEKKVFPITVEEAIERDAFRGAASVGPIVIRDMARRHMAYDQPVIPQIGANDDDFHNGKWAVICDLDGTLALFCKEHDCGCHLNHRNPYDASSCFNDTVNWPVLEILKSVELPIIFMSGREDRFREETVRWLEDADERPDMGGFEYTLHMRRTGDMRKDSVVKAELFQRHVRYNYNILFVLDDRNQVVDFWRSIGLTCLQVAEGDF